jgi:predicted AlkP superfamily pyrophosphatase or phosphodiesterase
MLRPLLFAALLLLAPVRDGVARQAASAPSPLLLISLDGFRWDYLSVHEAPNLARLAAAGVRAEAMIPVFPTKTFPNHYTIVTGLYPEHHGIVSNTMYDPAFGASFSLSARDEVENGRWWGGEPLWVTAERQGLKSATCFWPGSEAPIRGVRPTYWMRYDAGLPGEARVAQVLDWLDLPPAARPAFVTLYFSEVDHFGHEAGPLAAETAAAVRRVDGYLGQLLRGLEARGLLDTVNLVIVSDHGMVETSPERVVYLEDFVDLDRLQVIDRSPVLMAYPAPGYEAAVYAALRQAPHLQLFWKENLPARLHFRNHRRIPPLIGLADEGWSIALRRSDRPPEAYRGGTHGYDPAIASMHSLFVAHGPAFRKGVVVGPFENVHLYNLMATVLGLVPSANDGRLDAVATLLADPVPAAR